MRPENLKGPGAGNTESLKSDQLAGSINPKANRFSAENQQCSAEPITVTIDGRAIAKGRARFTRIGFAYTPAKTRRYEAHGRLAAQLAMGDRPPLTGPVHLTALVELPIPTSWSKRRTAAAIVGEIRPTSRPDVDNYLKSAMDAINGIVIADDSLIVEVTAEKKFGVDPKLVLLITPLGAMASNREAS
jgi:Holliday junction resolvase RusA-like endonuclease